MTRDDRVWTFIRWTCLIDEYNSAPPADTKHNDLRLVSSLVYGV